MVERDSKEVMNSLNQKKNPQSTPDGDNNGNGEELINFPIKNVTISKRELQKLAARYTIKEISDKLSISKQHIHRKCKKYGIVVLRGSCKSNLNEGVIIIGEKRFDVRHMRLMIEARKQGDLIGKIAEDNGIAYMGLFDFFHEYGVRPVKLRIQDIQDYIHHVKPGWMLISKEYTGNKEKIRVLCDQKHEFNMLPMNLLKHQGCRSCYKNHFGLSMEKLDIRLAKEHPGAQVISLDESGQYKMAKIRCEKGHVFVASCSNLLSRKSGCVTCYKENNWNLDRLDSWLSCHHPDAKILSKSIANAHDKVTIQCENGHITDLIVGNIVLKDSWCKICNRVSIEDFKTFLERERPGSVVLDDVLKGTNSRITIKCPANHTFKPVVRDVYYKNSWCPECKTSWSERFTRRIFELLFDKSFPQTKFSWLISRKGYPMHLDGYNRELNLGFENNGSQHAQFIKFFHKTVINFEKRKNDDVHKKRLCKEHGIVLVHVPDEIKGQSRVNYIITSCQKLKVELPVPIPEIDSKGIQREIFTAFYNLNS
jgi:hypothetical protein